MGQIGRRKRNAVECGFEGFPHPPTPDLQIPCVLFDNNGRGLLGSGRRVIQVQSCPDQGDCVTPTCLKFFHFPGTRPPPNTMVSLGGFPTATVARPPLPFNRLLHRGAKFCENSDENTGCVALGFVSHPHDRWGSGSRFTVCRTGRLGEMGAIGFVFKSGPRLRNECAVPRRAGGLGDMETIGFVFKSGPRLRNERAVRRRAGGLGDMETIGFV